MIKIPNHLTVGGHQYKIIQNYHFTERADLVGQSDHNSKEIRINSLDGGGQKLSHTKIDEVFIHELLHCIDVVYNASQLDEGTITRLGEGLYQVLKINDLIKTTDSE